MAEEYTFDYTGEEIAGALEKSINGTTLFELSGVDEDTTLSNIVPQNNVLNTILVAETAGNDVVISIGTTAGAGDVIYNEKITASTSVSFALERFFSKTSNQSLYLSSSDWNSSELDINAFATRIIA